ncbi:hypothetical protein [Rossellomorea sp. KS-H15a]|uniref:hypothetical protein n=1 Tax=Rossellomorea sp. KS-H15a TaxID=2963940 RepID=UPI0020C70DDA|nr:hypothetical protein [Rossellomorea sp. KS-H15a]UTE77436.1 hypothetical protein M1J35_01045 [Rossellomorea sp. KS-H15a]
MDNSITIGIIGPEYLYYKMKHCLKMFPNFQPVYRMSDHLYDATSFTKELSDMVDVLLFTGWSSYSLSRKCIPAHIPAHYVPLKGAGLYRALFEMKKSHSSVKSISIDSLKSLDIKRVLEEVNEELTVTSFDGITSVEHIRELIDFHIENFHSLQSNGAITGLKAVADELKRLNIPAQWVVPTEDDIIVTLERALLSTEKRQNRETQIVFGLIQIDGYHELVSQISSEHLIQRQNLQLNRLILDYVEELEGHLTTLSGNEYMFITTRGVFERVTQGYKWLPLIEEAKKQLDLQLSIGIGFGLSANAAGTHARIALMQAKEFGGECCFIVKEDRSVFGPVELSAPITYPIHITDNALLKKAEQAGMSAIYQQKLISLIKRKRQSQFTAQELAETLGITARSAHRIILKWLDAELINIIGFEKILTRGRPRQVYELTDHSLVTPSQSGGKSNETY